MDEQIKSNLALEIAQLSLDKATLQAQNAELKTQVSNLQHLQDVINGNPTLLELVKEAMEESH